MAHSTHCRRQQGFTIIELMIAVAIVGALAGLAIPNYLGYLDKARLARCIAEIRYIERAIDSYEAANESLPNTLVEVGAGDMVDPWGNPYEYLNIAALTLPRGVAVATGVAVGGMVGVGVAETGGRWWR
jgi:general secretion pathway protein G